MNFSLNPRNYPYKFILFHTILYQIIAIHTLIVFIPFFFFLYFFFSSFFFFTFFALPKMRGQFGLIPFWSNFCFYFTLALKLYSISNLCYFYNSLSSSYLMTFIFCFDKFHFYPCILYKFRVSKFSHLANNNYEKFKLYL